MSSQPLVSVIIPCFDAEPTLAEAVRSALDQTYGAVEVIVVDDGSTDGSAAVIASFGARIRPLAGPNQGASAARNRGLAVATGALIQFLDADDLLAPQKLARQVPLAVAQPDTLTYTSHALVKPDGEVTQRGPSAAGIDPVVFAIRSLLTISAPLHWRASLSAIGGFREELGCGQDYDLQLRLACAGATFTHLAEPLYTIRRQPTSISADYVRILRVYPQILWPAYDALAAAGQLSDERARAFAGFLASAARHALHRDETALGLDCLAQARRMHAGGGLDVACGRGARWLHRVLGPVRAERLVRWRRGRSGAW